VGAEVCARGWRRHDAAVRASGKSNAVQAIQSGAAFLDIARYYQGPTDDGQRRPTPSHP
jgi:hypothetical protein